MKRFSVTDLAAWSRGAWRTPPRQAITGFSIDTRTLQPGELFVALKGERANGHRFVAEAASRGAAGAVVASDMDNPAEETFPQLVVEDPRRALWDIAQGHRDGIGVPLAGVTGSAGKTMVKDLLADMLGPPGEVARTPGNWNNELGLPLSLLSMRPDQRTGVFEIGMNHPGEIASLSGLLSPRWGVVTSVGAAHIAQFESEEAIAHEKAALLEALPGDGTAIFPGDGRWSQLLQESAPCPHLTVAVGSEADLTAGHAPQGGPVCIRERATGETVSIRMPVPGTFFIMDVLLAAAAARTAGADWPLILAAVEAFSPAPLRWDVRRAGGTEVVDDSYNANPLSMKAALEAFTDMPVKGRRWLVLGAMRELGDHSDRLHRELGECLADGSWEGVWVYGPCGEMVLNGATGNGYSFRRFHRCDTHDEIVAGLLDQMREGDAVLIKASRGERLDIVASRLRKLLEKP